MVTSLNALILNKEGTTLCTTINVKKTGKPGIFIKGMAEGDAKMLLLKGLTAIQTTGYKTYPNGFVIEIENSGIRPGMLTLPVTLAFLIASKQVRPTMKLENVVFEGDLKLDGEVIEMYNTSPSPQKPEPWPIEGKQIVTDNNKMHIVPQNTDLNLKMTMKGPYTVEVDSLRQVIGIIENSIK